MWICPVCNREFKNVNQSHYCANAADTIDGYIEQAPAERRDILRRVRDTIRVAAPDATEKLSWKMPTFWQGKNLIQFAVHKNHLGLYPGPDAVDFFAERLAAEGLKSGKGAIQIPWDRPMPYDLVGEITRYCAEKG